MGAGAVSGVSETVKSASEDEIKTAFAGLSDDARKKLLAALGDGVGASLEVGACFAKNITSSPIDVKVHMNDSSKELVQSVAAGAKWNWGSGTYFESAEEWGIQVGDGEGTDLAGTRWRCKTVWVSACGQSWIVSRDEASGNYTIKEESSTD
eukprot:TRINITY_DN79003_c0_g1_i1.p2 TRINITY_DN79003_c0_g1~~TRINITY_DN79003_c0_g1_i1.p2  ORF type:complete len:152 (+),score=27.26 TRINITY_DN79003_c0_g1_i1:45-500(+)